MIQLDGVPHHDKTIYLIILVHVDLFRQKYFNKYKTDIGPDDLYITGCNIGNNT